MLNEIALPWFTDFLWVIAVFVAFLLLCHVAFIRVLPLSSTAWKRVDYIWLSMAFVGLIGSVGNGREYVAKNLLEMETHRLESARDFIEGRARFGTSGAICREFVRSEFAPPPQEFERIQNGYNSQCKWFRKALVLIQASASSLNELNAQVLFGPYPAGGDQGTYTLFSDAVAQYNADVKNVAQFRTATETTAFEAFIRLLGPVAIALALALRMTKVTAEIKSDKKKTKFA